MKTIFSDLNNANNPEDGSVLSEQQDVSALFEKLRTKEPFMCTLESENGSFLTLGISPEVGCAQHTNRTCLPPYLMALGDGSIVGNHVFSMGGTDTEVQERHCLPFKMLENIAMFFVERGELDPSVAWEEI